VFKLLWQKSTASFIAATPSGERDSAFARPPDMPTTVVPINISIAATCAVAREAAYRRAMASDTEDM